MGLALQLHKHRSIGGDGGAHRARHPGALERDRCLPGGGGRAEHPSVFIEQLEWAFNDRSVVAYYEFIDSYNRNLEPIFATGEGSIEEALATIEAETNAAMEEKWASCTLDI